MSTRATLFDRELIDAKQTAAQARIAELRAGAESNYTWPEDSEARRKQEIANLTSQAAILAQALRASDFVDYGDTTVLSEGGRISNRIASIPFDFDLFARKPTFAFLGRQADSPALLFHYRAEYGDALCIIDLRYGTTYGFAALHAVPNTVEGLEKPEEQEQEPLAAQVLFSHLVRPQTIGINELSLWPIPIRLPYDGGQSVLGCDMSTGKGVFAAFRAWYSTHVPRCDGFIKWDDPSIGGIARLTWTEWWTEAL